MPWIITAVVLLLLHIPPQIITEPPRYLSCSEIQLPAYRSFGNRRTRTRPSQKSKQNRLSSVQSIRFHSEFQLRCPSHHCFRRRLCIGDNGIRRAGRRARSPALTARLVAVRSEIETLHERAHSLYRRETGANRFLLTLSTNFLSCDAVVRRGRPLPSLRLTCPSRRYRLHQRSIVDLDTFS